MAPAWTEVEARDYPAVLKTCLAYLHEFGGAVLKYPYSAGGKGARIMLNTWDVKDVYDGLMKDYKDDYTHGCGKKSPWPLLIEARMSGVEMSFRPSGGWEGPLSNFAHRHGLPGTVSAAAGPGQSHHRRYGLHFAHPMESPALLALADETIARPLIRAPASRALWRPA